MTTTLSAGIAVSEILQEVAPDKVYPLYADFETVKPCIVYQREGIDVERDKDGTSDEVCRMSIYVITSNYSEGVELAEQARRALEGASVAVLSKYNFSEIAFAGADEYTESGTSTYIQQLYITLSRYN